MSSHLCHAGLTRILNGEQVKFYYQEIDWMSQVVSNPITDLTTYKGLSHHLGNIVIFESQQMNHDSQEALFSPIWKNLSIANLEMIDTYIVTSHFIGVIPILYDGEVETSMMPEVVDKYSVFKPYYLLSHMSKKLKVKRTKQSKDISLSKLPNLQALMLSRKLTIHRSE